MTRFFYESKKFCGHCNRPDVDVVRLSDEHELRYSRHFPPNRFAFCSGSLELVETKESRRG